MNIVLEELVEQTTNRSLSVEERVRFILELGKERRRDLVLPVLISLMGDDQPDVIREASMYSFELLDLRERNVVWALQDIEADDRVDPLLREKASSRLEEAAEVIAMPASKVLWWIGIVVLVYLVGELLRIEFSG